jgi:hypothetical protein
MMNSNASFSNASDEHSHDHMHGHIHGLFIQMDSGYMFAVSVAYILLGILTLAKLVSSILALRSSRSTVRTTTEGVSVFNIIKICKFSSTFAFHIFRVTLIFIIAMKSDISEAAIHCLDFLAVSFLFTTFSLVVSELRLICNAVNVTQQFVWDPLQMIILATNAIQYFTAIASSFFVSEIGLGDDHDLEALVHDVVVVTR